jgi:hypothetical protein
MQEKNVARTTTLTSDLTPSRLRLTVQPYALLGHPSPEQTSVWESTEWNDTGFASGISLVNVLSHLEGSTSGEVAPGESHGCTG